MALGWSVSLPRYAPDHRRTALWSGPIPTHWDCAQGRSVCAWISIVDVHSQTRYMRYLHVSSGHTIQFGLLFAWSLADIDAAIEEHRGRVAAGREST
jgi:hypothetical protein